MIKHIQSTWVTGPVANAHGTRPRSICLRDRAHRHMALEPIPLMGTEETLSSERQKSEVRASEVRCQTAMGFLEFWIFRLSDYQTIGLSDYRTVGFPIQLLAFSSDYCDWCFSSTRGTSHWTTELSSTASPSPDHWALTSDLRT